MPGTWFLSVVATISTSSKKQSRGLLLERDGVTCGGRLGCVETSTKRRRIIRHALLLSLLLRWDGIITLQSICVHVVDLAHLKQHIGLLHIICGAARIMTTARSGRSKHHGKHRHGQCGKGQPHGGKSHRERALPGIKITQRNEGPTKVEPDFADMHKFHPQASSKHVWVQSQLVSRIWLNLDTWKYVKLHALFCVLILHKHTILDSARKPWNMVLRKPPCLPEPKQMSFADLSCCAFCGCSWRYRKNQETMSSFKMPGWMHRWNSNQAKSAAQNPGPACFQPVFPFCLHLRWLASNPPWCSAYLFGPLTCPTLLDSWEECYNCHVGRSRKKLYSQMAISFKLFWVSNSFKQTHCLLLTLPPVPGGLNDKENMWLQQSLSPKRIRAQCMTGKNWPSSEFLSISLCWSCKNSLCT